MYSQQKPRTLRWKAARLTEARSLPPNPWRGLYAIHPFMINGEENAQPMPPLRPGHSLSLVEINLAWFQEDALSDSALRQIDGILAWFDAHEREIILRFLYDWDGNGEENEPREITVILMHMRQLSPLLKRYARRIYTLQGLFVGSWGEMHSSRHLGTNSLINLVQTLDEAAEGSLMLAVRCPSQWRDIMQTYDPPSMDRMFNGKLHSRLGLFNDGILASESDFGTYGQLSRSHARHYGDKLNREDELSFQNRLCADVPNGGELVKGEGNFTLAETYRAFRMMRLSYLNADFDMRVIDGLRSQQNIARDRAWRGADAYTYLTEHLGYRYRVRKATVHAVPGGADVRVEMENTGFACCYFPLEATLYLKSQGGELISAVPMPADTRSWKPGDQPWLAARLDTLPENRGDYRLELGLTDPRSGKPVYLASAAKGEDIRPTLLLGILQIRD
jgi:hypothetical protein